MDKKKIVHAAREAIGREKERDSNSSGEKSFIDDVIGTFFDAVAGSDDDSSTSQSGRRSEREGKLSGRKPQSQAQSGGVASVGRRISDQLKNKK